MSADNLALDLVQAKARNRELEIQLAVVRQELADLKEPRKPMSLKKYYHPAIIIAFLIILIANHVRLFCFQRMEAIHNATAFDNGFLAGSCEALTLQNEVIKSGIYPDDIIAAIYERVRTNSAIIWGLYHPSKSGSK